MIPCGMAIDPIQVHTLEDARVDDAGAVVARAFFDDPLARHVLPDSAERARLAPLMFAGFVRYDQLFGRVDCLVDLAGVAAWQPPDAPAETPERLARAGLDAVREEAPIDRLDAVFDVVGAAIEAVAPEPHWHLRLLAVEPGRQGDGAGTMLLRHGLRTARESGFPVVLETFAERTVPFYLRNGFEAVVEGVEPASGLRYWALRWASRQ